MGKSSTEVMMYFRYDRISSHWIWTRWEDWGAMCHWYGHPSHNQNPNERFQIPCEMDTSCLVIRKISDTMLDPWPCPLQINLHWCWKHHCACVKMGGGTLPTTVAMIFFGIFNHPRKQPDWNRLEAPNHDDVQWFMMDHDQYDSIQN